MLRLCPDCRLPMAPVANYPDYEACANEDCLSVRTLRPPFDDAAILNWLQEHYIAIDFDYPHGEGGALIIALPEGARVGRDLRKSVLALLEGGR